MQRRREFYAEHPDAAGKCSSEERGEGAEQRCFYSPKENISLMLEYFQGSDSESSDAESNSDINNKELMTRYLNCPAALTVSNLKKFIRMKFSLPQTYRVEIMYADHLLSDDYTLMDIAYIYSWRRAGPMKFYYTFSHRKYLPKRILEPVEDVEPIAQTPAVAIDEPIATADVSNEGNSRSSPVAEANAVDDSDNSSTPMPDAKATEESDTSNKPDVSITVPNDTESSNSEHPAVSPNESEKMDVDVPNVSSVINTTPSMNASPPIVKIDTSYAPQNTILPPTNSIKLKLIHCPDPYPKARSKKSTGRKGGRTRYKSTPVQRFPRLAPYPPPHSTTPTPCLSAPNMSPLSQITVGKLVPSVMTTLAPSIVTALVSTTANTMCDVTKNSTMLPTATFLSQPPLCTHSNSFATVPNYIPVSSATVNTILPNVSGTGVTLKSILPQPVVNPIVSSESVAVTSTTMHVSMAENKSTPCMSPNTLSSTITVTSAPTNSISPTVNVSQDHSAVSVPITVQPSLPMVTIAPTQPEPTEMSTPGITPPKSVESSPKPEQLHSQTSEEQLHHSKTSEEQLHHSKSPSPKISTSPIPNGTELKIDCNGIKSSPVRSPIKDPIFCEALTPEKKASKAFEMSVKNSISAEFSDNDDLGCQPDLVVDEQKMDSSDNEDDTDTALRKKITAIAEKEDEADATDDTEADSGRASDISSQARSSCDDDIGSPMNTMPVSETVASTSSSRLPTFTLAVTAPVTTAADTSTSSSVNSSIRSKSNNINHVINNILRNHEKKDTIGALDLSTCTKKPGEAASARPKPVANPVLDIKHRQQTYLPAPNSNKQHTACVPSPKHPTSSPILMHGLTAHRQSLMPSQLAAVNRKSPHLPVPPFHSNPLYPSQTRGISVSSPPCVPGRSTPSYNVSRTMSPPVPTAHQGMPAMLTGIIPCMGKTMMSFPLRSATPIPSAMPIRNNTNASNHLKGIPDGKPFFAKGMVGPFISNARSMVPTTTIAPPTSYPATSSSSSHKSNHSTIPSYKRVNSYKNYNGKYAVINPDPNGYQNKMLIRNLDARPNNSQQSHKL
ncbi:polycomb complex protein BMI-1-A [Nephila pilipes]|uniref:Polycomb complex protein BMI-1-A n=1 Tax=Nephila pilipes TaxID=299642 RepID=A0A8X6PZV0_NEPPI|nr:polycomb complex protein BMI-1-A [Nephila pilipes]